MAAYFLTPDATFRAVLMALVNLAVPVAIGIGILRYRPVPRVRWWLMAMGHLLVGIAASIDGLSSVVGDGPGVPSVADVLYLPGYTAVFVGLFLLVHRQSGEGARSASIDSSILSTALGAVVWTFVVRPATAGDQLTPLGLAVTAAYPLIDVAMLGLAVTLTLLPGPRSPTARLLALAIACTCASDLAWTYVAATGGAVDASLVDLGRWLGPSLWAAAALHPTMAQVGDRQPAPGPVTRWRIIALGVAVIVAPLLILFQAPFGYTADLVLTEITAIGLSLMVILRLTGTLDALAVSLATRSELQGALSHQARHDPLTGLANRVEFGHRLAARLEDADRPAAVLLLDLDDFKAVNDSQGHPVGDALLVAVADRLRRGLRDDDLAARLGGDEFGILLDDCPDATRATEVARRLLASFGTPFEVDARVLFSHASIGIALTDGRTREPDDLLRDADIAMYLAKGQGKGRAEVYQPTMHATLVQRLSLRADLQEAIAGEQFVLQYQPIFAIADRRLTGVEALVRWQHPVRGMLAPGEFIGLAEETGLIVPLGRWVLGEACRQLAAWRQLYPAAMAVSMTVNVSAIQLQHPAFLDHVREALRTTGVPASNLVVELTESVLTDRDDAAKVLEDLKATGVRIALDDFGTGYSSLSQLGRFPIDVLKIDRSFTSSLGTGSKEAALTATILELASTLDLTTIAEGVEEPGQLAALAALGCDMCQGFLLARPLQPAVVAGLIDKEQQRAAARRPTGARVLDLQPAIGFRAGPGRAPAVDARAAAGATLGPAPRSRSSRSDGAPR